jgi:hypothetical protein
MALRGLSPFHPSRWSRLLLPVGQQPRPRPAPPCGASGCDEQSLPATCPMVRSCPTEPCESPNAASSRGCGTVWLSVASHGVGRVCQAGRIPRHPGTGTRWLVCQPASVSRTGRRGLPEQRRGLLADLGEHVGVRLDLLGQGSVVVDQTLEAFGVVLGVQRDGLMPTSLGPRRLSWAPLLRDGAVRVEVAARGAAGRRSWPTGR